MRSALQVLACHPLVARNGRIVMLVGAGLCALYLIYVLGVAGAIWMGALTALTKDSADLKLEARSGYSLWPGSLWLSDLDLRFKDHNIEVQLQAREALLRVSILPLFSNRIEVDEFRVEDGRFRVLHRVRDGAKHRERLAAFPNIGFKRSKVYDSPEPAYRAPPFRIVFKSIEGNMLEAWILEYRALGHFAISGGFDLGRDVRVLPSRVIGKDVALYVGARKISEGFDCDLRATIASFPGASRHVAEVVSGLDGAVRCSIPLRDLSPLRMYWAGMPLLLEGRADVDLNLALEHGQVKASTAAAHLRFDRLGLATVFLVGSANVALDVGSEGEGRLHFVWHAGEHPRGLLALGQAEIELRVEQRKLWDLTVQRARFRLAGLEVGEPRLWTRLFPDSGLPLVRVDKASLKLDYTRAEPLLSGRLDVSAVGAFAVFQRPNASVTCAYESEVHCQLDEDSADCRGSKLRCSPLTLMRGPAGRSEVSFAVLAEALKLRGGGAQSEWSVHVSNPREVLERALADDAWARLGLALVPLADIHGRVRANWHDGTIAGTVERFRSGPLSGRAGFVLAHNFVSRWRVETPMGRFGIGQGQAGLQITPFVPTDWDILAF